MSPPEGEVFSHVALSSSATVVTTDGGECHVMQHIDNEFQKFLLATSAVEKIYASGDTLAILHTPSQQDGTQVPLTVYMIESKQVIHCCARAQGLPLRRNVRHQMNIMIGTSEDYLVLFEKWFEPGQCHHFSFTRFSLDGQTHSQGSLQEPINGNSTQSLNSPIALDVNGCLTIWSYRTCYGEGRHMELMRVQYDPQQNKLQLKTSEIKLWLAWDNGMVFFWKDVACLRSGATPIPYIIDLSKDEPEFCTKPMELSDKSLLSSHMAVHRRTELAKNPILGDGNFIVSVCEGGYVAWCFNKDIKMAGEDEDYAQHRQMLMRLRLERRRIRDAKAIAHISG